MKSAIILTPNFEGHRQVYTQYFIELLLRRGFFVHTVSDQSESNKSYPYLDAFRSNPFVRFEAVPNAQQTALAELRILQDKLAADVTILLEADDHLALINHQLQPGYPRLRGKNIGIFIRSINYVHHPINPPGLWDVLRFVKHFPTNWVSNPVIFHEFTLSRFKLLDVALTVDEWFVARHSKTHKWLPDMVFPLLPDESITAKLEIEKWRPLLTNFIECNRGKEILLYFGVSNRRRGYNTLLKLASEENCCFIHCGQLADAEMRDQNMRELRNVLNAQGLLFETNEFIQCYPTMQLFFEACKCIVLPYWDHFGSSGVMLQAIHFGIPILVPDQGLMAVRTKQAHLGLTFHHNDYEDLKKQWRQLIKSSRTFLTPVNESQNAFSVENAEQAINTVFDKLSL